MQHGNVIQLKTGLVGIDEACSGVRSLQAAIMVSLFLGELYRATWQRRIVLVVSGVLVAFLCNLGRTFLLCSVVAKNGIESFSRWHDPAGFIILGVCFFVRWGLARFLSGAPPRLELSKGSAPMPFPPRRAIGLAMWLLLTVLGTEGWYWAHEARQSVRWSVEWPVAKEQFSTVEIPNWLADERRGASWVESDGSTWTAFFLRWSAGPPSSRILARLHRPENCLPAAGYKLRANRGIIEVKVNDVSIPFRALDFDHNGRDVYVFGKSTQKPASSPEFGTIGTAAPSDSSRCSSVNATSANRSWKSKSSDTTLPRKLKPRYAARWMDLFELSGRVGSHRAAFSTQTHEARLRKYSG
jgi:exosortase/archaeosortase family protein